MSETTIAPPREPPAQEPKPEPPPAPAPQGLDKGSLSQWQLMRIRFSKHKAAMTAMYVLIILYAVALFAEFFSPYDKDWKSLEYAYCPPQIPGFTWEHLKRLRDRWTGKLLVKGILHPQDAIRCAELGCDGIVVSNHGGRQVAFGPPTIEALPAIAEAVGGRIGLLLDSGVRRGADILRARALGADFVLAGRALAFGAGAGGAQRAMDILKLELVRALGQVGATSFGGVGPTMLTAQRSTG